MRSFSLSREKTGLLVVDVQERLFPYIDHSCEVMKAMQKALQGFKILQLPIVVSEQYPQGLGETIGGLKAYLEAEQKFWTKSSFSCMEEPELRQYILSLPIQQWVLMGIEAHVCVLQTVRDLLSADKQVVVLNDAVSSRSIYDFSTAIAEMRDCGARISSIETILFELLKNSKAPEFKQISQLVK